MPHHSSTSLVLRLESLDDPVQLLCHLWLFIVHRIDIYDSIGAGYCEQSSTGVETEVLDGLLLFSKISYSCNVVDVYYLYLELTVTL
jgi:hypothetical protein